VSSFELICGSARKRLPGAVICEEKIREKMIALRSGSASDHRFALKRLCDAMDLVMYGDRGCMWGDRGCM
jgi:hypothetical protein